MDHDGQLLAEVVIPQLNVSRRMENGEVNPYEVINQQIIYATSAGMKSTFAYEKLIDTFEKSIIDPKNNFTMGLDYRIPVKHGLISKSYVQEQKLDPSYSNTTFAMEYLGIWQGGSEESWFNFDMLSKYRKMKNAETRAIFREGIEQFYLISIDIGRLHDSTVATIFRVNIRNGIFYSTVVNIVVLGRTSETRTFTNQVIDIKKLIKLYQPKEVVIDINGLGISIADEVIKTHYDENGEELPPYGFFNDKEYLKIQPKNAEKILFGIKANGILNSKIHSNTYSRLSSGKVRFLITEQEAKIALMATEKGRKMSVQERIKKLMPYEMTTKLFSEMSNLRLKKNSNGIDIELERINSRYPKDKYSSFSYGLWRIKELEEEYNKKKNRHAAQGKRQLCFFTGGI